MGELLAQYLSALYHESLSVSFTPAIQLLEKLQLGKVNC